MNTFRKYDIVALDRFGHYGVQFLTVYAWDANDAMARVPSRFDVLEATAR